MHVVSQTRIVGGVFGLPENPDPNAVSPSFLEDGSLMLVNARSGIFLACKLLSVRRVWMPSYLCKAVIQAVEASGAVGEFYGVDTNLEVCSLDWLNEVRKGDLVIIIDYFGFPADQSVASAAREKGAYVLEDASHALLSSHVGSCSDFVVFSPRKVVGVPDGGILQFNNGCRLRDVKLALPPRKWFGKSLCAAVGRSEFDRMGGSRKWFRLFQEAEAECPVGKYRMSAMAKALLREGFNYNSIAERRLKNYRILAERLENAALFSELPAGVVPLGFPIRLSNRDQVRDALFREEIYSPVHWALDGFVPGDFSESHQLSFEIMTLPCDQRCDAEDMEKIADVVSREMKS